VEKLAEDFLDGKTLSIASVRPVYGFTTDLEITGGSPAWADVLNDREILDLYASEQRLVDPDIVHSSVEDRALDSRVIVEVQASCRPRTTPIRNRPLDLPSKEALRLAAELWERGRENNVICETQVVHQSESDGDESDDKCISSASGERSRVVRPTAAWTSSKWLETGAFVPRRKGVNEDCSKDELGASSFTLPSQRARGLLASEPARDDRNQSASSATTVFPDDANKVLPDVVVSLIGQSLISPSQADFVSGRTASADESGSTEGATSYKNYRKDGGSPSSMRRSLRSARRSDTQSSRSKSSVREQSFAAPVGAAFSHEQSLNLSDNLSKEPHSVSLQAETDPHVDQAITRRQSAPLGPAPGLIVDHTRRGSRGQYNTVVGSDSSPFAFRKRLSRRRTKEERLPIHAQVVTTPLPTPSVQIALDLVAGVAADPEQNIVPSTPNKASEHQTSTPLADQQMNRVLPTGSSEQKLKELLRDEMESAGAIFTSLEENEVSTALLPKRRVVDHDSLLATELNDAQPRAIRRDAQESQHWAGTQILLAKAQQDLFTSPDKLYFESQLKNSSQTPRPQTSSGTSKKKSARHPLLPLSQGHIPSTQALLDTWQGWSTIKKPHTASMSNRKSLMHESPSLGKAGKLPMISNKSDGGDRRRSSLRVTTLVHSSWLGSPPTSIVAKEPVVQAIGIHPAPQGEAVIPTASFVPTSFLAEAEKSTEPQQPTNDSAGTDLLLPSGRETQEASFDRSELDFTITQLAEEVLGPACSISF
jgi:hypothetical protein